MSVRGKILMLSVDAALKLQASLALHITGSRMKNKQDVANQRRT
jgi:hypothetical protein